MERNLSKFPDINKYRPSGSLKLSYIKYPELLSFSYYTNLDLSLSTLGMESTLNLQNTNSSKYLKPNTFGISVLDERQDYSSFRKRDMNYNNLFIINDSKNIYPLSYTLLKSKENINNALYTTNNTVSLNIDNYYIKERSSYIYGDYTHLRESDTFSGFFKPDNISTELKTQGISIKSTYTSLMNDIRNTNNDINIQLAEEITYIPKFRIMYGSSLSDGFEFKIPTITDDLFYKDKIRSIKGNNTLYVDYGINDFYLVYKVRFTYKCTEKLYKYFMFNKNDISVNINHYVVSFNKEKSFVYDITYNEYNNGIINGHFYLALYFDIYLDNLNTTDIQTIRNKGYFTFQVNVKLNGYDTSFISKSIHKLVDEYSDVQLSKRLYHDYIVGYNYEHRGNYIGTCVLPSNFYSNIASKKPVFVYKKPFYEASTNIFKKIHSYGSSLDTSLLITTNRLGSYSASQINSGTKVGFKIPYIYYGSTTGEDISTITNHFIRYSLVSIGSSNMLSTYYTISNIDIKCTNSNTYDAFSPKKIFTNNIKDGIISKIFNLYESFGNETGIRINDIYVPNIFELQFIKSIKGFNEAYYSSTIISESNKYYAVGVASNSTTNINVLQYKNTQIDNMTFIGYFKIPDICVLNGSNYHIIYSKLLNYECIDYYYNKTNIVINIQKNYNLDQDSIYCKVIKGVGSAGKAFITENTNGSMININYTPRSLNSEILVYYTDSDYTLNNCTISNSLGNSIHCRILCKISVKTKSFS